MIQHPLTWNSGSAGRYLSVHLTFLVCKHSPNDLMNMIAENSQSTFPFLLSRLLLPSQTLSKRRTNRNKRAMLKLHLCEQRSHVLPTSLSIRKACRCWMYSAKSWRRMLSRDNLSWWLVTMLSLENSFSRNRLLIWTIVGDEFWWLDHVLIIFSFFVPLIHKALIPNQRW